MATRLFDLPSELRIEISQHAFVSHRPLEIKFEDERILPPCNPILFRPRSAKTIARFLISKRWLAESLPVYLKENTFSLRSAEGLTRFHKLPLVHGLLRNIHLEHHYLPQPDRLRHFLFEQAREETWRMKLKRYYGEHRTPYGSSFHENEVFEPTWSPTPIPLLEHLDPLTVSMDFVPKRKWIELENGDPEHDLWYSYEHWARYVMRNYQLVIENIGAVTADVKTFKFEHKYLYKCERDTCLWDWVTGSEAYLENEFQENVMFAERATEEVRAGQRMID